MPPSDLNRRSLGDQGFAILPHTAPPELVAGLRVRIDELFAEEGESAGSEFKQEPGCRRLANLVDKGDVFARAVSLPAVLELVRHVLGPEFKLSSLNARSVDARSTLAQPLHADMGAVADERGYWVANVVWMLDPFTPENGALRVVPGSHRWRKLPQDVLDDPAAPHPDEQLVTGKAGTLAVINAHLWHGGTANTSDAPRTAMHAFYCRRDKPQQQYQKRLLRPDVQRALSPELRDLLALDDALNDQLSAADVVRSGFLK